MKSIAIVTDGYNNLGDFLENNLRMIFEKKVNINKYYINDLKKHNLDGCDINNLSECDLNNIIMDDVILVMLEDKINEISDYVLDKSKIIVIERSINHSQVYRLFSIPKDTEVLVVNDNEETTNQTIEMLNNIGINHLKFIPYIHNLNSSGLFDSDLKYNEISVAVTPGEANLVPSCIENTIDLGFRYIDIMIFYELANRLMILDRDIFRNMMKYDEKIVNLELGVRDVYKKLFVENSEYSSIIELSENGMIFVSEDDSIRFINNNAKKILNLSVKCFNCKVNELKNQDLVKLIRDFSCKNINYEEGKSSAIKYNNKNLNVSAHRINQFGKFIGTYYCIQDETYIRKLEQNLSKKLKAKGFVARYTFADIYTKSDKMLKIIELTKKIADLQQTVLITGESGTGKEIMAQSIHNGSKYSKQPFIAVNCAAISENLLESELFGYEAGSFTGALKEGKAGLFEQANNGTIFLDEIGDMNMYMQTKLLRVLQENQVMRVGSSKLIDINVRVIAATNVDLTRKMKNGKFRKDLYYRLNVLPIRIPSLKEHKEDIIGGIKYFMKTEKTLDSCVEEILNAYDWPGNMRELANLAQYLDAICDEDVVTTDDLPYDLRNFESKNIDYEIKNKSSNKNAICNDKIQSFYNELEDVKIVRTVLEILCDLSKINIGCGRKKLIFELENRKIKLSESKVRRLLSSMKNEGLIVSDMGRSGSYISDKGLQWLREI